MSLLIDYKNTFHEHQGLYLDLYNSNQQQKILMQLMIWKKPLQVMQFYNIEMM